jgi:hypothetical protein
MRLVVFALTSLPLAAMTLHGSAAAAAPTVREACMPEIKQMCSAELAARSREKVKACLQGNKDKLSEGCRGAIAETQAAKKD